MLEEALEHLVKGIVEHPDDVQVSSRGLRREDGARGQPQLRLVRANLDGYLATHSVRSRNAPDDQLHGS